MSEIDPSESDRGDAPAYRDTSACAVAAFGVARVSLAELAVLRKAPGPPLLGVKLPPSLLKHADPQTVASLAAVLRGAADAGWSGRSFDEWAVVAAPRFLGRITATASIDRFTRQGPSCVSPLVIPTMSLHAVAGTLSLAIKSHGFNYSVGGGPNHLSEALMAGMAARDDGGVPGVWVVASGFSPEPVPDLEGGSQTPTTCYAVALALVAGDDPATARLNLRLVGPSPAEPPETTGTLRNAQADPNGAPLLTGLVSLVEFLEGLSGPGVPPLPRPRPRRWYHPVLGGGAFEVDDDAARAGGSVSLNSRAG